MKMPSPKTYERQLAFMPYKKSLEKIAEIVCAQAPKDGSVLDLMCGPGYLLEIIKERRNDLFFHGVDNDANYIIYASQKHPRIVFEFGDVLTWKPKRLHDVVRCTGALHHIPYERQEEVIKGMSRTVIPDGLAIVSDCYIDDYRNETERMIAAAKLGYKYLIETIRNGAPKDVVRATTEILMRDVMLDGEFKTSIDKQGPLLCKYFKKIERIKTWPDFTSDFGDYIHILKN
ncbi:MAG: class I SAM-dependent methyltransferase [Nanoarchaeota archaeon]|nr:class I SAM-dependent methyltransferase [Nanoarchaeota archaeon]